MVVLKELDLERAFNTTSCCVITNHVTFQPSVGRFDLCAVYSAEGNQSAAFFWQQCSAALHNYTQLCCKRILHRSALQCNAIVVVFHFLPCWLNMRYKLQPDCSFRANNLFPSFPCHPFQYTVILHCTEGRIKKPQSRKNSVEGGGGTAPFCKLFSENF